MVCELLEAVVPTSYGRIQAFGYQRVMLYEQEFTLMKLTKEDGIIKYGIAWLLGVPASLLILIFLASRAC
jgi:hypothetical protein